jgi:hypothetical protein
MNTATVSNTNLFAVAAQYLGDATQWVRIAQLNRLVDSEIAGTVTLALPPLDLAATGGVVMVEQLSTLPVLDIVFDQAVSFIPHLAVIGSAQGAVWDYFNWDDGSVWE